MCVGTQNDSVTCGVFTLFGIERDLKNKKTINSDLYEFFVENNLQMDW